MNSIKCKQLNFQFAQIITGCIYPILTTISIGFQTSLYDVIGEEGCIIFWLSSVIHPYTLVIGGLGMAVFRLICVLNAAKHLRKERLVTIIHIGEMLIICFTVAIATLGIVNTGFEQAGMYQFCKDYGTTKAGIYHTYHKLSSQEIGKLEYNIIGTVEEF